MNLDRAYKIMKIKQYLTILIMVAIVVGAIVFDFSNRIKENRKKMGLNKKETACNINSLHGKGYLIAYVD